MRAELLVRNDVPKSDSKEEGQKRNLFKLKFDWTEVLKLLARVRWWTPIINLMKDGSRGLERMHREKREHKFREMVGL